MIYIKKQICSKELQESINKIKHSEIWKNAEDENTSLLRNCFDSLDKEEIKRMLLAEQHGLCAYCMSRITIDTMMIDHWMPLSKGKKYAIDYKNFAGCCCGGRTKQGRKELCCDASKEDAVITINPWNKEFMNQIKYTMDGKVIFAEDNPKIFNDINYVLKLNGELDMKGNMEHDTSTMLVANRRRQYKKYRDYLRKMNTKKYSQKHIVSELKKRVHELEKQEEYEEYVGVLLYFLKRKIRMASN